MLVHENNHPYYQKNGSNSKITILKKSILSSYSLQSLLNIYKVFIKRI